VEAVDEANAGKNEKAAHQKRAKNSPEKHAVLVLLRDGKVAEDQEEQEQIIYAERKFEHIAGGKFEGHLASLPQKYQSGKGRGQSDPQSALGESLARADNLAPAVKDEKVQHQHAQREQVEENPEGEQAASPQEVRNL